MQEHGGSLRCLGGTTGAVFVVTLPLEAGASPVSTVSVAAAGRREEVAVP